MLLSALYYHHSPEALISSSSPLRKLAQEPSNHKKNEASAVKAYPSLCSLLFSISKYLSASSTEIVSKGGKLVPAFPTFP